MTTTVKPTTDDFRFLALMSGMGFEEVSMFVSAIRNDPVGPGPLPSHGDALLYYSRHDPLQEEKSLALRHRHAATLFSVLGKHVAA